jgi:hypothetical protein
MRESGLDRSFRRLDHFPDLVAPLQDGQKSLLKPLSKLLLRFFCSSRAARIFVFSSSVMIERSRATATYL